MSVKVSIVITTKNRKKDLFDCINSIDKSTFKDYELIIVDDVSSDGTEKLTNDDFKIKNLQIYHLTTPHRMVRARNFGAKKSKGKYVLFIDDDNEIDTKMIENLVDFADKHSDYGIIGPINYCGDRKKCFDYQKINFFTSRTHGVISDTEKDFFETDGTPNVFMIKKEVFDKVGFFDEDLIQTYTEPDFAFHAGQYGYKCAMVSNAKTIHKVWIENSLKPRGLGGNFKAKAYCLMRNRSLIVKRYGKWYHKLIYLLLFSWLWFFIYSFFILKFKRFDLVKCYWYGLKDGLYYFFTNKYKNSLDKLIDIE